MTVNADELQHEAAWLTQKKKQDRLQVCLKSLKENCQFVGKGDLGSEAGAVSRRASEAVGLTSKSF